MAKIDTVVFDLGGVLIDWNPDYVFKTIFRKDDELKKFYEEICTADWNEEQDAGRTIREGTDLLIKQFPDHEANIRAFYDRWPEMLGGPIHGTVDIFRQLKKKKYKTYALTNWSAETFPIALDKYVFLHWFDGRLVSGEHKTRKPFIGFYETLIERFNINPSSAVYVDDNARNLEPAKKLGFHPIHFKSHEQFKSELEALAVL
ncbi:MAG: HAD family phosphatase [Chitinophagaceae bacterium]|nr:HAD family phosphatase [Chitinophagaceae bacterium]